MNDRNIPSNQHVACVVCDGEQAFGEHATGCPLHPDIRPSKTIGAEALRGRLFYDGSYTTERLWVKHSDYEALRQRFERTCARITELESSQGETTAHAALIAEIFERHGRCSKLLWGPAALPGMMLGPEDADAAHHDRGTLLSLLPQQVKTTPNTGE